MATRILVVDDSPTIRAVVSTLLERHGYEPKLAVDGQDAFDALASGEVKADLVLVDFVMPRMNGFQLCRALRDDPELGATPVVLMSAKADRIRDQFVQQTGAMDAITKPFDGQALVAVIENVLRRVNAVGRASSARLPELDVDDLTPARLPAQSPERETRRAHLAELVAQRLASAAARAIGPRPELGPAHEREDAPAALMNAMVERLSDESVLEMMAQIHELRGAAAPLLSGDLGVVPIGAILQLLQAENQTGVLVCTSGSAEVRATFRAGAIDLVQSTGAGDEFRLGRFFLDEGVLTAAEIDEVERTPPPSGGERPAATRASDRPGFVAGALDEPPHSSVHPAGRAYALELGEAEARSSTDPGGGPPTARDDARATSTMAAAALAADRTRQPLGLALLTAGKIVESQLRVALTRQSSELLYEVLRWHAGRFELRREPPSALAESARLGLPVASVVMEGFRRVDEWRVLERSLGSFDAVLLRDDTAFGALDVESLPAKERAVLDAVDGERTVRAIVAASHLSSFDACRILLVQLLEARALRRRVA